MTLSRVPIVFLMLFCFSGNAAALELENSLRSFLPNAFNDIRGYILDRNHDSPGIGKKLGLPLIEISLSRKDIATFLELHRRKGSKVSEGGPGFYQANNTWRKAKLRYRGSKYRIKIKSHSRDPDGHRKGKFISLGVKLRDGKQIHQAKRFNLIIRERLSFWSVSYLEFAQRFGLLKQQIKLVRIKINDWEEKLYYFERRLSDRNMEAQAKSSFRRFRDDENLDSDKSMIFTFNEPEIPFSEDKFKKRFKKVLAKSKYPATHKAAFFDRYVAFNRAIANEDEETLVKFLDFDYITSFVSALSLGGLTGHSFLKPNLYVFYNIANGKFYPVLTRDARQSVYRPGPNQTLEQLLYRPTSPMARIPLFMTLSRSDRVRQEKYKKIHRFLETQGEETIESQFREWKKFGRLHLLGLAKLIAHNMGVQSYKDWTGAQFEILRKYLRRASAQVEIGISNKSLTLRISPNSMPELKIDHLKFPTPVGFDSKQVRMKVFSRVEGREPVAIAQTEREVTFEAGEVDLSAMVENLGFSKAIGKDSKALERIYTIRFEFDSPFPNTAESLNLKIGVTNNVTGEKLLGDRLIVGKIIQSHAVPPISTLNLPFPEDPLAVWRKKNPNLPITPEGSKAVRLLAGEYSVFKDTVFPEGRKLILEAGTVIRIDAGKVLLAPDGLDVRGTKNRPVIVTSLQTDIPFGSFGVLGQKGTTTSIQYLHLSNGSERWHDGVFFSGGLSVHYNDRVTIENSVFRGNKADDGVNVKNSKVVIRNTQFIDNFADQIDLDYCEGIVFGSRFATQKGDDINGDGVDVSGGNLLIVDSRFSGFGDKGVSIGEKSRVYLSGNEFANNNTGVAVKDLSVAYFSENFFHKNRLDIKIYQKKQIFGGSKAFVAGGSTPQNSRLKIKLDKKSSIHFPEQSNISLNSTSVLETGSVEMLLVQLQNSFAGDDMYFRVEEIELLPSGPLSDQAGRRFGLSALYE